MLGSVLFLAAAISAPSLTTAANKKLFGSYPDWAVLQGKSSAAQVEIVVEPDGKARSCTIVWFVGDERLAQERCTKASRQKFIPAKGLDGQPTLGTLRTFLAQWIVDDNDTQSREVSAARPTPDLTLKVDTSTLSLTEPLIVKLVFLIDSDGFVKACTEDQNQNQGQQTDGRMVEAACEQAAKVAAPILLDRAGAPTAYVINSTVRLEPAAAS
ncbi:MAG: hypothetical protein J7493_04165 [Porphyrobacter sp.]|nr:hypothetical protein [Porphyrobacter sp.]